MHYTPNTRHSGQACIKSCLLPNKASRGQKLLKAYRIKAAATAFLKTSTSAFSEDLNHLFREEDKEPLLFTYGFSPRCGLLINENRR